MRGILAVGIIAALAAAAPAAVVIEDFDGTSQISWLVGGDGVEVSAAGTGIGAGEVMGLFFESGDALSPFQTGSFVTVDDGLILQFEAVSCPVDVSHVSVNGPGVNDQVTIGAADVYSVQLASAGAYTLTLSANTFFGAAPGQPVTAYFDNFTLVPEPASLTLAALGAAALLRRRR